MMKKHHIRSRVKPGQIKLSSEKPKTGVSSDPIFRLLQNSRRVPPSAYIPRRDSSFFHSLALTSNKVWSAFISRRRRKRNLYEELENTIDELEDGTQMTDEKLSALKNRIKHQDGVSKSEERK
jgi:hypothetical protein